MARCDKCGEEPLGIFRHCSICKNDYCMKCDPLIQVGKKKIVKHRYDCKKKQEVHK